MLRLVEARAAAGTELRTAVLEASIDVERAKRLILDQTAHRLVARDALAALCDVDADVRLVQPPPQQTPSEPSIEAAYEHRAVVREANKGIDVARRELDVARMRPFFPTLSLLANYTRTIPATPFVPDDIWSAIFTLTVPLYDGGNEYLDIEDKRSALAVAQAQASNARRLVRDEVVRARAALEVARNSVEVIERQIRLARENYELVAQQARLGAARPVDVTLAQTSLVEAEDQLVVATFDREIATLRLRFALGSPL